MTWWPQLMVGIRSGEKIFEGFWMEIRFGFLEHDGFGNPEAHVSRGNRLEIGELQSRITRK